MVDQLNILVGRSQLLQGGIVEQNQLVHKCRYRGGQLRKIRRIRQGVEHDVVHACLRELVDRAGDARDHVADDGLSGR